MRDSKASSQTGNGMVRPCFESIGVRHGFLRHVRSSPRQSAQVEYSRTRRNLEVKGEGVSKAEAHAVLIEAVRQRPLFEKVPSKPIL
jgi:hypothetical protein